MSIYVLNWLQDDLRANGDDLKNYTLLDIKGLLKVYNDKYVKQI